MNSDRPGETSEGLLRAAAQPSRGLGDAVKPAAVRAGERSLAAARSPGEASEAWPRPA